MAVQLVAGAGGFATYSGASAATHAITMPADIAEGHLVVVVISYDTGDGGGSNSGYSSTGWTSAGAFQVGGGGLKTEHGMEVFWRVAPASPASTYTWSARTGNDGMCAISLLIDEHDSSTTAPTATNSGEQWVTDNAPDPPTHNPGANREMWLVFFGLDENVTITTDPTNYTQITTTSNSGDNDELYAYYRVTTATSETPGAPTTTGGGSGYESLMCTMSIKEGSETGDAGGGGGGIVAGSLSLMGVGI